MATAVIIHWPYSRETRDIKDSKIPLEEIVLDNVDKSSENKTINTTEFSGMEFEYGVYCGAPQMQRDCTSTNYSLLNHGKPLKSLFAMDHSLSSLPPSYPPPPTYDDALLDAPPDYTSSDKLVEAHKIGYAESAPIALTTRVTKSNTQAISSSGFCDFEAESGFRQHMGKGKKNKKVDDWPSDDDEKKNEKDGVDGGGDAGGKTPGGGDGSGGAAGGSGGAGDDGGEDGGGGYEWAPPDKRKKKNRKAKAEEEEEQKKKEEQNKKQKQEDEDEAAAAAAAKTDGGTALSWAEDTGDALEDNNWGVAKKKKEKKKKPGVAESGGNHDSGFHDVNLQDANSVAPKINMSFGETDKKESESGFNFGSTPWGPNAWGSSTKSPLASVDADKTDKKEKKIEKVKEKEGKASDSAAIGWGFAADEKKKKSTTNIAPGFEFGLEDATKDDSKYGTGDETDRENEETWGEWNDASKKKTKKNTGGVAEEDISASTKSLTTGKAANTTDWVDGATTKRDKKKTKKGGTGDTKVEETELPKTEPEAEEDNYGGWNAANKQAKAKSKQETERGEIKGETIEEEKDTWSSFASKKDKSKDKRKGVGVERESDTLVESNTASDDKWTSKTDKISKMDTNDVGAADDDFADGPWATSKTAKKNSKLNTNTITETTKETKEDTGFGGAVWGKRKAVATDKDKNSTPLDAKKAERDKKKKDDDEKKKRKDESDALEKEQEEAAAAAEQTRIAKEEARKKKEEDARKKEDDEKERKKKIDDKKSIKNSTTGAKKSTKELEEILPPPLDPPTTQEDLWEDSWTPATTTTKKKPKKNSEPEAPPRAPSPPAMGLTPEPEDMGDRFESRDKKKNLKSVSSNKTTTTKNNNSKSLLDDLDSLEDIKPKKDLKEKDKEKDKEKGKEKEKTKEDTPAKAATTSKSSKLNKEKDKQKDEEEKVKELARDGDLLALLDGPISNTKSKPISKPTKTVGKSSDKVGLKSNGKSEDLDTLIDLVDVPSISDTKLKEKTTTSSETRSIWGSSSKKTPVKKEKETKEIGSSKSTNQDEALKLPEIIGKAKKDKKVPEETDIAADLPPKDNKDSKSASKMKASATSAIKGSVAEKVKALEKSKLSKKSEDKEKDKQAAEEQPPPPPPEPPAEINSAKSKPGTSSKIKSSSTVTKPTKTKDLHIPAASDKKSSKDIVPGSFPDDQADLMDLNDTPVIGRKSASKIKTSKTKSRREEQVDKMDDFMFDGPEAGGPPTPPPESKPKKERARIVKDDNTSSWGLWGTAPKRSSTGKKTTKPKDDADVLSPTRAKAGLGRSKSTRTAKEKEKEESRSSGGSEKEKRAESRPRQSRQSTFGSFFSSAPAPASRPKTTRRPSTTGRSSSHRQSAADAMNSGIPSPPPEDDMRDAPEMNEKAAKLMGVGGKDKRKKRSVAPDPYAIDDDDMVIVNPIEDPIINAPIPKNNKRDKPSRSRSKPESKILSDPDDIVMVDRPSPTGVDNDTSFERAAVQRSNTSARKSGFMGLFGIRKPEPESSRAISGDEAYGGSRRKRLAGEAEEGSKRPRRSHRSERLVDDGEGITTDAPATGNNTEVEDPEARREARKARKEDKERQARKNELRDLEERRARRELKSKGATEERKSKIREAMSKAEGAEVVEDLNFIEGEETDKPRRHKSTRETDEERRTRHKPNRKSSHIDGPLPTRTIAEEDERRSYRNSKISSKRDVKDNKQKNAPVTDYFDLRNSKSSSKSNPYAHNTAKGADKTSSWVNSQVLDPPAVPPIEGTVIEQDPILGPDDGERDLDDTPVDEEEERRRRKRTERRRSRADRVLGEEEASRRRRVAENGDGGQRSSEGSEERDYERERRRRAGSTGYGRPTMDKRTSWFKKLGI